MAFPDVRLELLEDDELVEFIGNHFKPELEHLKHATPSAESRNGGTSDQHSPSYKLFGAVYAEIDRTILSVLCLKWILTNNYDVFTASQSEGVRLSRNSFSSLAKQFIDLLESSRDVVVLIVAIVVADIGKDTNLATKIEKHIGHEVTGNHDQLVYQAAKAGLIPCLHELDSGERHCVLLGLEFAANLNIPQLVQAENLPGSLSGIRSSPCIEEPRSLHIKFLEVILDVAGAAATKSTRGSVTMTEDTYHAYTCAIKALTELISTDGWTELQCYNTVLDARALLLKRAGFQRSLSTTNSSDRALLRLMCMGRVTDRETAECFEDAFNDLDKMTEQTLSARLNANGLSDADRAVLPYYAPALFARILSYKTPRGADWTRKALLYLMGFLNRACIASDNATELCKDYIITRDLSFILGTLTSDQFKENPAVLDNASLPREQED